MSTFRRYLNRTDPGIKQGHRSRRRLAVEVLEDRLTPATIVVTTHADVVAADGKVSLREAITRANNTDGRETIVLRPGRYQIALAGAGEDGNARGDFDITDSVTIQGAGAAATVIDAANLDRVFDLTALAIGVAFSGVTIRNGFAPDLDGGGIRARGVRVTLNQSAVRENAAGNGGGLFADSNSSVTLRHSTVTSNVADDSGGGIFAQTLVLLNQSRVTDNRAEGSGGGIHTDQGTVGLRDCTVSGNIAGESGGGINAVNGGEVIVLESTVSANASGLGGGGISDGSGHVKLLKNSVVSDNVAAGAGGGISSSFITVARSTVARNVSGLIGGGIEGLGGEVTLTNSVVADNVAIFDGGGIADRSVSGSVHLNNTRVNGNVSSDPIAFGGGLYVTSPTLTLTNSTVRRNRAGGGGGGIYSRSTTSIDFCTLGENSAPLGGGIYMDSDLELTRSTLWGNRAGVGGGLFLNAGDSRVFNVTLSGNTAAEGSGGGLFNNASAYLVHATVTRNAAEAGGGVVNNVGTLAVKNTIIAQNQASDGAAGGPDVNGEFTSEGSNLVGIVDGSSGFDATTTDIRGTAAEPVDARLKPLANNGGPTLTHALMSGSRAIDRGDNDIGFPTDQRGFDRTKDGDGDGRASVDMGALEK